MRANEVSGERASRERRGEERRGEERRGDKVMKNKKTQKSSPPAKKLTLLRHLPAPLASLLVDVDVALLAVVPLGDPGALDLLGLLLLLGVLPGEGVEELFYEAGHFCVRVVGSEAEVVV
jgi:hypothetical protein